jgi:hypothetical protein
VADLQMHSLVRKHGLPFGLLILSSLCLGAVFQVILKVGDFWLGFWAASLLFFLCGAAMYIVWGAAGDQRVLGWMMLTAFFLRMVLGVFLAWGLPLFGYDEPPQRAGFVYFDPYQREGNAWALAQSEQPLLNAFSDTYVGDQYGGLFVMSAFIYRYLSPDAFRPVLITILSAGASALSLPFLVAALRRMFGGKTALLAGWVMALYPESILLGASQMREPFFILFFSIMLWSGGQWLHRSRVKTAAIAFSLSIISLFLLSFRVAVPITGVMLVWVWIIKSHDVEKIWLKRAVWAVVAFGVLAVSWSIIDWVNDVLSWDTYMTILRSGMIQAQLEKLPEWMSFPFVLIYGLFQPVLPAAIAAPAPWIWRGLAIFRSVGWYALLPVLIYASVRVWRLEPLQKRHLIRLMVFLVWAWILIASARAGGDQWDNPRYRTIFLPLMATLGAWGINLAQQTKDRWLWRGLLVEGIFLGFFTQWYISRYYSFLPRLPLEVMIIAIVLLSAGVIIFGWLWDRKYSQISDLEN